MSKVMKILCCVFGCLGLVFLLVGTGLQIGFQTSIQECAQINGHIVSFSGGNPVVAYQFNGYEGQAISHIRTSWQRVGDPVKLWVNTSQPGRVMDEAMPFVGLVFLIIGGSMLLVAGIMFAVGRAQQNKLIQLTAYGKRVSVTVTDVKPNYYVKVNRRHPYRVYAECVHPFTGDKITVQSMDLWKTSLRPGDQVDVLFDPMNEKRYAMDVEEGK